MQKMRLYSDLSWLWPLWGTIDEYRTETDVFAGLIKKHAAMNVQTLLDIGCGGGKNLFHFKRHFRATGIDLSEKMLENCRKANPDCELHLADMRSFDLGKNFDAVYLNDALPHLTTLHDLKLTFECAYAHLNSGGVMVLIPEFTKENFVNNQIETSHADPSMQPEGIEVIFVESLYDDDPSDDVFEMTILYLIREKGFLRIERDDWTLGLFHYSDWIRLLKESGFDVIEIFSPEGIEGYTVLVCSKISAG